MDTSSASKKPLHTSDTAPLTESSLAHTLPRETLPRVEQSMEIVANTSTLSSQDTPSHNAKDKNLGVSLGAATTSTTNTFGTLPKPQQLMQDTSSRHAKEKVSFGILGSTATTTPNVQQSMQVTPSRHASKQASLGGAKPKNSRPTTPLQGTPPKSTQIIPSWQAKVDKNGVRLGVANPEHHLTPEGKVIKISVV